MAAKIDKIKDAQVPTEVMPINRLGLSTNGFDRYTPRKLSNTVTLGCAGTALIALMGLIEYVPGLRALGNIHPDYIPMAPSTSGCFLILSMILFCHVKKHLQGSALMAMVLPVLLTTVFGLTEAIQPWTGVELENWLFPQAGMLGTIPVGRMSPATGAGLIMSGLATLLLLRSRSKRLGNWTAGLGGITVLFGATVLLAYLYGTPLMYGGSTVPMAATTALGFIFLGTALVAAAGSESFPIRLVIGDSTSARLSRAFIPLTIAVVLLQSFLSQFTSASFSSQHAVFVAFLVIVVTMITVFVVARTAHSIGGNLDESNRKLNESEARLYLAVKNSPFPIMIHAEDGEVVQISDAWTEITGYSHDEIPTISNWTERAYGERKQSVNNYIDNLYNLNTKIKEGEYLVRTKSGEQRAWDFMSSGLGVTNDGRRMVISMAMDVTERKLTEENTKLQVHRSEALLELPKAAEQLDEVAFMQRGQELAEDLTGSQISFIHFVNDDEETIELVTWSRRTLDRYCHAAYDKHYPVSQAGIWADALLGKKPVVFNDYATSPNKRGLPAGHSELKRLISVPVIEHGKVVMLAGVGNKETDYTDMDVETVQLISNEIWQVVQRRRIEIKAARFSRVLEQSSNEIYIFDSETLRFVDVNLGARTNLGYSLEELQQLTPLDLKPELSAESYEAQLVPLRIREEHQIQFETMHRRKDGSIYPVEVHLELTDDQPPVFVAVIQDITERKNVEQDLRIAATAFEAQEAIIVTDAQSVIIRVNQAFSRVTGYSTEEAIGKTPSMLNSGHHDELFFRDMWETIDRDHYWQGEIWNRHKNGEVHPDWLTITAVTDLRGKVTNYVSAFSDITQHKKDEEAIHSLAFYDPLTKLPNRRLLYDRLQHTLAASARYQNHCAVLFIDLDNFKNLNDTKGHNIGDLLLIEVAARLLTCVREGDTVARLGGDEFVVMLEELSEDSEQAATQAEVVGDKILAAISKPYILKDYEHYGSASIGISLFRSEEATVEELLKRTDTAMYEAKNSGRNTLRFYDPNMQVALESRTALEKDLRIAISEHQFKLYYQIQADHSGHIYGAEVLIRWQCPSRGLVSPLQFIPLAEETGLILPIGQWVLETVCTQLKSWEANPLTRDLQLAVNVSARQFRQADFVERVRLVLHNHALIPDRLKLELTESLVLDDIYDTISKMQALRGIGVRFSMDDFGTGYSSLSYLTQLPLDQLKIDQSFVRNIGTKSTDAVIVQTIIGMANNLGMEVIAEGVETEEQRAFLEQHGCAFCQGYLFGRPVPLDEFEARLTRI